MMSSLSSYTASAAAPAPYTSARVIRSSRRRLLFFSAEAAAAAATSGLIQTPGGEAYPFAGANVKKAQPQPPSTPYSQSQSQQQFGLDAKGRIRACPSTNPGCVSTNPTVGASCSLASPLIVPANTPTDKAAASLREAILKTQRNAVIKADEETAYGHYIRAEVDGGRDVMEFLLKESGQSQVVAAYRCVATKVIFVYPFTTAVGDSRGQSQRIAAVSQELGWYAPDLLNAATADDHHRSILDF
uniref:Thylakoid lumenal 17.9 kDa protein, chloroplastic n=1 Tax=Oryza punctata TaxID=4537 RepID=A0A0E0JD11_ORYPU